MAGFEVLASHRSHDGELRFCEHVSAVCGGPMRFSVYLPPRADGPVPVLWWLSGLTCTEENFVIKAGAQRTASALGLMLVAPDTSPRGQDIPGEEESYDLGTGAGFYLDATRAPWSTAYRMYSYLVDELPAVLGAAFPAADLERQGIFGHSMGGHGALTLHLKHPDTYRSVSAFAPVSAPMRCPWGQKAFSAYLGEDRDAWRAYDASELIRERPSRAKILIDQGTADEFLELQLRPDLLVEACEESGQHFELRMQPGYDHSYYFIQSFVADHLRHHAEALKG